MSIIVVNGVEVKRCSSCKELLPLCKYHKDKSRPDGINHRCKDCNLKHSRKYYKSKKEGYTDFRRGYELNYYYGITLEDYDRMAEAQDDKCAVCGKKPEKFLAVDHCHKTKKVRGLLCRRCNIAMGLFDDDMLKIKKAYEYLEKYKEE